MATQNVRPPDRRVPAIPAVSRGVHGSGEGSDHGDDAASVAHQAACLMCYRFYRRGMDAEGWRITRAGTGRVRSGSGEAPCRYCAGVASLWVRLRRGHPEGGERQRLGVCRGCGHIELREYHPGRDTLRALRGPRAAPARPPVELPAAPMPGAERRKVPVSLLDPSSTQ